MAKDLMLCIWDVKARRLVFTFTSERGEHGSFTAIGFSSDEHALAVDTHAGYMLAWRLP